MILILEQSINIQFWLHNIIQSPTEKSKMRRNFKKNTKKQNFQDEYSITQNQQEQKDDQQQDQLNAQYVQNKRANMKGRKNRKRKPKKQVDQDASNQNSEQVIDIKQNDEFVRQHIRPDFLKRWDGESNYLELLNSQIDQMSPMLQIYWKCKSNNMTCIVFVQIGGMQFFAFENDAIVLHEIFKKKLKKYSSFLMVNFWYKEIQLAKQELFERNIPVLIMNEVYDPQYRQKHKIIRRQVTQIITPGIHLTMNGKSHKQRWLIAAYLIDLNSQGKNEVKENGNKQQDLRCAIIALDSQSNKFYLQEFKIDHKMHQIRRIMNRYRPVEFLTVRSTNLYYKELKQMVKQTCNPYVVELQYQNKNQQVRKNLSKFMENSKSPLFKQMMSLYSSEKVKEDKYFSMFATVKCLQLVYQYLTNLQLRQKIFDQGIFSLQCFSKIKLKPFFDSQVYQNLEVFRIKTEDDSDGKPGTLVKYLDRCHTNSGKKLLRRWINEPLIEAQQIYTRQKAISEIVGDKAGFLSLHQKLIAYQNLQKQIADVYHWVLRKSEKDRYIMTNNISFEKGYDQKRNPAISRIKDILKILNKLDSFQQFLVQLEEKFSLKSQLMKKFTNVVKIQNIATKSLQEINTIEGVPSIKNIIQKIIDKIDYNEVTDFLQPTQGTIAQYDSQKNILTELDQKLVEQLQYWKEFFKCPKITFVSVRSRNQIQIPKAFIKGNKSKQLIFSSQTASFQRYTTSKTIELSQEIMEHEKYLSKTYEPFLNMIINEFCSHKYIWDIYVRTISELDVLMSIGYVSKNMVPRCLPIFTEDSLLIKDGIHIGLDQIMEPHQLVPNTISLNKNQRFVLLTGPNMGGKSTFLKQTCLLAILAQIGSYVPAKSYESIVFDQIFCRIGASDRLVQGKSTFYVQLEQTKRIVQQATPNSLVIIDELGRGTSTYDGMAIAQASIRFILEEIDCYTLFSTHYTPITRNFVDCQQLTCMKMSYKIIDNYANTNGNLTTSKKKQKNQADERLEFTYQLQNGVAEKSFANNVARMVGMPNSILQKANQKAEWISKEHEKAQNNWKQKRNILRAIELGWIKIPKQQEKLNE